MSDSTKPMVEGGEGSAVATPLETSPQFPAGRLVSVDAMRGFTMMMMILVNNPGSWGHVYPPLLHAAWHGCTPTDLVYPFFLFIIGVVMPFTFERRLTQSGRAGLLVKVFRRSAILFMIGFALGAFPTFLWDPSSLLDARWPGVLQRIALCYLFVSLIVLYAGPAARWAIAVGLMLVYWLGMAFFPVPGHGAGVYEPVGNLCWWLDNQLLFGHTWEGAPAAGFDPEGVWSTLTAVVTTLLGYFAGQWLRNPIDPYRKLVGLFLSANIALLLAYCLTATMPINKHLWTTSYVCLTAGLAVHCLAMFYWWIDVRGNRFGVTPLLVLGMNAIFAYVVASLAGDMLVTIPVGEVSLKKWIYAHIFLPWASPKGASLAMGLCFVAFCWAVTWILYAKRIFIRV
jgi:predicted acyltransferase